MPCQGPTTEQIKAMRKSERDITDELTQNLCYLCGQLKAHQKLEYFASGRILQWFKEHEAQDSHRVRNEMSMLAINRRNLFDDPKKAAQFFISKAQKVHPVSDYHKIWFIKEATVISERLKVEDEIMENIKNKLTPAELKILKIE